MKNKILVPVDYSENALSAARYACQLALLLNSDVQLLHVFQPFNSAFQSPLANKTDKQRAEIGAQKGMAEFLSKLNPIGNLAVECLVVEGLLLDSIEQVCIADEVIIVVMGTHGASGVRADLIGSNTYNVAKTASKPLVVVPHDYVMKSSSNVTFFTNYHKDDLNTAKVFASVFHQVYAKIFISHILPDKDTNGESLSKLASWAETLEPSLQFSVESILIEHAETLDTVFRILKKTESVMCLLTLAHDRNFFENLFHKSLAKAIIMNPYCPVFLAGKSSM